MDGVIDFIFLDFGRPLKVSEKLKKRFGGRAKLSLVEGAVGITRDQKWLVYEQSSFREMTKEEILQYESKPNDHFKMKIG